MTMWLFLWLTNWGWTRNSQRCDATARMGTIWGNIWNESLSRVYERKELQKNKASHLGHRRQADGFHQFPRGMCLVAAGAIPPALSTSRSPFLRITAGAGLIQRRRPGPNNHN